MVAWGSCGERAPLGEGGRGGAGLERGSRACYADPAAPPEPRDTREAPERAPPPHSGPRAGRATP